MGDKRSLSGLGTVTDTLLWAGAGVAVMAVHAGAVMWMLYDPPAAAAENASPPAIMIEMAAETEAVLTEENHIAPDMAASVPVPEEVEPEPVEEQADVQEPPPALPEPEAAMPVARPKPPEPVKKVEKKREPVRERRKPQAAAAVPAQAQVKQGTRTAAAQNAAGTMASSLSPARWQSRLMAHLERRKRFPAGAQGKTGVAHVRFTLDAQGNVLSASLARASGVAAFDAEVVALVRRASPLPAPPAGVNRTVVAPVKFENRR
jgi:periplasmic protein TonB